MSDLILTGADALRPRGGERELQPGAKDAFRRLQAASACPDCGSKIRRSGFSDSGDTYTCDRCGVWATERREYAYGGTLRYQCHNWQEIDPPYITYSMGRFTPVTAAEAPTEDCPF